MDVPGFGLGVKNSHYYMIIPMKTTALKCIWIHNVWRLTVSSEHEQDEHCHKHNDDKWDQSKTWDKDVKYTSMELTKSLFIFGLTVILEGEVCLVI